MTTGKLEGQSDREKQRNKISDRLKDRHRAQYNIHLIERTKEQMVVEISDNQRLHFMNQRERKVSHGEGSRI